MSLFNIMLPILLIPFAGFMIARREWLTTSDCDSIAKLTFTYLVPSLLFTNTATATFPEQMDWAFLSAFYGAVIIIFLLAAGLGRFLFSFSAPEQGVFGMGAAYSNVVIIGLPVCTYTFGSDALLPLFLIISIHNMTLFGLGIFMVERQSLTLRSSITHLGKLFTQLLKSPITASLIVGLAVNGAGIRLYPPLLEALERFSLAAVPLGLFVLGASMNRYRIKGHIKPALLIVLLKCVGLPLLVWFFSFHLLEIPPLWGAVALVTSAMPSGLNAYIFSRNYQLCGNVISTGILLSTILSIVTLTIVLAYVQTLV